MSLFNDAMCLLSGPATDSKSRNESPIPESATPRCVYPLTRSQEGMWIEFQADSLSTKYNLTLEWNLVVESSPDSTPDINDVLRGKHNDFSTHMYKGLTAIIINNLTNRYPAFRSLITLVDGKPHLQEYPPEVVDPEVRVIFREQSAVPESSMTTILRKPFQLDTQFPARWVILRDSENFRVYVVAHHIAVDGQSMSLISREFMELLDSPTAQLPSLSEFSKMHMVEKAWAGSQLYKDNRDVLMAQVKTKNNSPWPNAPAAKSTAKQDCRKIDSWSTLPKSELELWSNQFKTSWFRVANALIGLLLLDITRPQYGNDEVISVGFGSRPKDMMSCVGQFANALPVKVPLWQVLDSDKSDRSFKSLVSMVGKNISAVKKAEIYPALEIARACREQNIDYQPPRVAVTYSPKLAKAGCRLFPVEGSWDLFFCFLDYEEDVKLGVIYNPEAFSGKMISSMKEQFESLISLSKVDGVQLDDMLDWLPKHPRLPMVPQSPETRPCKHIHHWFEAHAESHPDAVALHSGEMGTSLTYGDLQRSTDQKARILRNKGVGCETRVVLSLRRGFAVVEWMLAVLKSGGAFVYLDPEFSDTQKNSTISNCKPALTLTDESAEELVETYSATILVSEEDAEAAYDLEQAKYATADEDLAYMIYTSGSTGEPKGVMVEHGNIAAFIRAGNDTFEVGYGARVLQLASFSFDASLIEWAMALCTGATLCFSQNPKQLVGDYLADVIEQNEVSFMQITPTALETLPLSRELPSLRQISAGGEAPSREVFARWHSRVNLVNFYGPTEAAVGVARKTIGKTDVLPEVLSAGQPIPETTIHICSEGSTAILKPNSPGEICISGPQLARGYCEKPEETTRRFIIHPNGTRMYRTGDRGVLTEDGSLQILGRIDREMKIRGFRIAPEEVENAILNSECGVWETSVQVSSSGSEMVAFVAPMNVNTQELSVALKKTLASYKVPSRFIPARSLPKSVSGKTDHKAVRAMRDELSAAAGKEESDHYYSRGSYSSSEELSDSSARPSSHGSQKMVARIWQDVLGMASPPPEDVNFFDIGGHSILVSRLHEKLKSAFPSSTLRLVDLFHQSTIKQQALLVCGSQLSTRPRRSRKTRRSTPSRAASSTQDNEALVARIWQDLLQIPSSPPANVNFFDIGGHSLMVPKLHARLKNMFPSKAVQLVDLFHQSTIRQQAALVGGGRCSSTSRSERKHHRYPGSDLSKRSSYSTPQSTRSSSRDSNLSTPGTSIILDSMEYEGPDVAIVGMSGRFPCAKSPDEFYEKLLEGYSGITSTTVKRDTISGNTWVQKAGSLQDVEEFDHKFWSLSKEDAMDMDPQQRLFLDVAYEALVDAGVNPQDMDGRRMGLFVGAANSSYHLYTEPVVEDPFLRENRGFVAPSLSARTAYHLNISGPNVTVQTNCASSTVALSQAVDAIRLGRCDSALVGGVSVQLFDGGYKTSDGQIFSIRGEVNPFDGRADGTVPADAVTAVVIKRSSDAVRDRVPIYANILGTGIGSDGALEKAGFQVPSPRGQAEVIKSAWKVAGITPERLKYAEIHGSGTPVGDALELEGLCLAVKEAGGASAPFTVGSTKGNIGNAQNASGLVSLIKLCKSMQRGLIPATKGFQAPNDMINRKLPITFASQDTPLNRDDILAVSASGWGGVNSHLLLGFPEAHTQKQSTISVPPATFSRQTLAAPRLQDSTPIVEEIDEESPLFKIASTFSRHASNALGRDIDDIRSNLKDFGLDSMAYVSMTKAVSLDLAGQPVGVPGMMLSHCSPLELAKLWEELNPTNGGEVSVELVSV